MQETLLKPEEAQTHGQLSYGQTYTVAQFKAAKGYNKLAAATTSKGKLALIDPTLPAGSEIIGAVATSAMADGLTDEDLRVTFVTTPEGNSMHLLHIYRPQEKLEPIKTFGTNQPEPPLPEPPF